MNASQKSGRCLIFQSTHPMWAENMSRWFVLTASPEKGGVAFVMEQYYGFKLPKEMHKELADKIQSMSEVQGEISPEQIMETFRRMYIDAKEPLHFRKAKIEDISDSGSEYDTKVFLTYTDRGVEKVVEGFGNGPIDAVQHGLCAESGFNIKLTMYHEHALTLVRIPRQPATSNWSMRQRVFPRMVSVSVPISTVPPSGLFSAH